MEGVFGCDDEFLQWRVKLGVTFNNFIIREARIIMILGVLQQIGIYVSDVIFDNKSFF